MKTPHWTDAASVPLEDWGLAANIVSGHPQAAGKILSQNADGSSECGLWSCTPGTRRVSFPVDEFCYFTGGSGAYIHESGEEIAVSAGSVVFFRAGWTGLSVITETLSKAFMCR